MEEDVDRDDEGCEVKKNFLAQNCSTAHPREKCDKSRVTEKQKARISPMSFHPGVPSCGRRKKKRQGAPTMNNRKKNPSKTRSDSADSTEGPPKKRGRGRPLGSKNKPKDLKEKSRPKITLSQLKKTCGKPTKATVTVAKKPSGLKCCTCDFDLDPKTIVPGEVMEKCPECGIWLHSSCLKGVNGCENCEMIRK